MLLSIVSLLYICFFPQYGFSMLMRELRAERNPPESTMEFTLFISPSVCWSKSLIFLVKIHIWKCLLYGQYSYFTHKDPQSFCFFTVFESPICMNWLHCHVCTNTTDAHPNKSVHEFRNESHSIPGKQTVPKCGKSLGLITLLCLTWRFWAIISK